VDCIAPDWDMNLPEEHPSSRRKRLLGAKGISDFSHYADAETHLLCPDSFGFKQWIGNHRCSFSVHIAPSLEALQICADLALRTEPRFDPLIDEVFELCLSDRATAERIEILPSRIKGRRLSVTLSGESEFEDYIFSEGIAETLHDTLLGIMELFVPSCMRVIYGGLTPEDAVHLSWVELGRK